MIKLYGGEIGFDGDMEARVASRCRQATLKVATKIKRKRKLRICSLIKAARPTQESHALG